MGTGVKGIGGIRRETKPHGTIYTPVLIPGSMEVLWQRFSARLTTMMSRHREKTRRTQEWTQHLVVLL